MGLERKNVEKESIVYRSGTVSQQVQLRVYIVSVSSIVQLRIVGVLVMTHTKKRDSIGDGSDIECK